jgi:hypothetical protein
VKNRKEQLIYAAAMIEKHELWLEVHKFTKDQDLVRFHKFMLKNWLRIERKLLMQK